MKKYIVLFLALGLIVTTSCSSDDDEATARTIVGTWILTGIQPPALDPTSCENESMITFEEDNSAEASFYFEQSECVELSSTGTWEKVDANTYVMEVPQFGELEGQVTFIGDDQFTFSTVITIETLDVPAVFTFERA